MDNHVTEDEKHTVWSCRVTILLPVYWNGYRLLGLEMTVFSLLSFTSAWRDDTLCFDLVFRAGLEDCRLIVPNFRKEVGHHFVLLRLAEYFKWSTVTKKFGNVFNISRFPFIKNQIYLKQTLMTKANSSSIQIDLNKSKKKKFVLKLRNLFLKTHS